MSRPGEEMSTQRVFLKTGLLVYLTSGLGVLSAFPSTIACAQSSDLSPLEVETLIGNLENDDFKIRESAERDLIRIGVPAARSLAAKVIGRTPESAMRSARILQDIGARAIVESEMMRLSCAMEYLTNHGFPHFRNSASQIASRWKTEQAGKIREQIRECGIGFRAAEPDEPFVQGGVQVMVIQNGFAMEPEQVEQAPLKHNSVRPDNEILSAEINEIFQADETTIMQRMKEVLMEGTSERPVSLPEMRRDQAIIVNGRMVQGGFSNQPTAIITSVDESTLKGLVLMRLLPSVPIIAFTDCEIPDDFIVEFARVPGLQVISLTRCRYKPATILKFLETNPAVVVDATGHDAFLGVSVQSDVVITESGEVIQVCTVLTVVPESAAEVAGILVDDQILEIDGLRVTEFNQLIVCIASHQVGDDIAIKYLSQGEERQANVTLRNRPEME